MSAGQSFSATIPSDLVIESCHSTWLFDTDHQRFRRVLKGLDLAVDEASTGWRPYYRLDMDPRSESFTVIIDPTGSRVVRAWRHAAGCRHCAGEVTAELPIAELSSRGMPPA
jgi:hypothetical protein